MDWIAVLPADCPEDLVAGILRSAAERGWNGAASRGQEQVVVTVSGARDATELASVLPRQIDRDVLPLLSRGEYRRFGIRRALMAWLVRGLGLLVALTVLIPIVGFLRPPAVAVAEPDQIRVAAVGEILEDAARTVRFQRRPVLVIRLEDDQYYALGATCSYTEECQLEWIAERHEIVCPCHGDAFDVFGNVLQGPASIPLRRYTIERIGNDLFLARGD